MGVHHLAASFRVLDPLERRARGLEFRPVPAQHRLRELLGREPLLDRRDPVVEPADGIVDHLEDVAGIAQAS
jgi:hypothetical protein